MLGNGEKGDMLDVGIVFWVIRDEMMDIVVLPVSSLS
jgi:hypothetical protein